MLLKLILELGWFKRLLRPRILLLTAALLVLASGSVLTWRALTGGDSHYEVAITESGFVPDHLEIREGDTISFANRSVEQAWPASDPHPTHEFLDGFDPLRPLNPNDRWDFTFSQAGEWGYHDHLLPHRRGSIVVGARSFAEKARSLFSARTDKDAAPAGQSDTLPPEIAQLLQEKNKTIQAKIVRGMAEKYGPAKALDSMAQSGLPYTGETHLLVHEIGDVAYERYGEDALRYCNESFLSACYHGVILHMLADHGMEGATKTIERCKDAGIHVFTQCAHAAGHGFLAWKDYHVLSALPLCDALGKRNSGIPVFNCYDGVFMENIFGVHEGKPSPNRMVKADDPYYPCDAVPEKYRGGCWTNQATLMVELFRGDLRKVAQQCDKVENREYRRICYDNFARQIHPLTEGKTDRAITLCDNATGAWKETCLLTLINAAFSVGDRANMPYEICAYVSAQKSPRQNACYQNLFGILRSYATSDRELEHFCGFVREEPRRIECLKRFNLPDNGKAVPQVFSGVPAQAAGASGADIGAVQDLIRRKGAGAAYALLKEQWKNNQVAAHDLAHMVGRFAYGELGIGGFSVCDENFAFGCYHGLLEELIKQKGPAAIELARGGCNALAPPGRVASCIHGIGHGILAWKSSHVLPALDACSSFPAEEKTYCADGVFMEYYTGAMQQTDAIRNRNASDQDAWGFCLGMPQEFQSQCVRNRAFFLLYRSGNEPAPTIRACAKLSGELKNSCVRSAGLFATQRSRGIPDAAKKTCAILTDADDHALCVSSAAQEFIFERLPEAKARELCNGLTTLSTQQCFAGIDQMHALYNKKL